MTCLIELDDGNKIITGSYDTSLKLWDRRKINCELQQINTGKQIWDIKFNEDKTMMTVAGVYDGY